MYKFKWIKKKCGTPAFRAPEVGKGKYNGLKADIFSLGASLIFLVTGKLAFNSVINYKSPYQNIIRKQYNEFWSDFENKNNIKLSPEFKDLCNKMICLDPNLRLTCGKILEHDWFKEINEMKDNKKEELEQKIRNNLLEFVEIVKKNSILVIRAKNVISDIQEEIKRKHIPKSIKLDKPFFLSNLKPKYENIPYSSMNINNCIKIQEHLDPSKFMNNLCYFIKDKYGDDCFIDNNKNKLKFNLIFQEKINKEINEEIKEELKKLGFEQEEEEDEEQDIYKLLIQVKFYQISEGYLLQFAQLEGNKNDFLDKFDTIAQLVRDLI